MSDPRSYGGHGLVHRTLRGEGAAPTGLCHLLSKAFRGGDRRSYKTGIPLWPFSQPSVGAAVPAAIEHPGCAWVTHDSVPSGEIFRAASDCPITSLPMIR